LGRARGPRPWEASPVSDRDGAGAPLRLLLAATYVASVIGLFTLVLIVTEVMNVLPAFYFNVLSWRDAILFVLAVALWYWLAAFVAGPAAMRRLRTRGPARPWIAHGLHLLLLFALVHVLNTYVFVTGIVISVWSEIDYARICHALIWLLWQGSGQRAPAGGRPCARAGR
jgi:hypothetical protein